MTITLSVEQRQYIVDFEAVAIDLQSFDHAAHIYITWLYLCQWQQGELPRAAVMPRVGKGLQALAASVGAHTKYSQTITQALVQLIAHAFDTDPGTDFAQFQQRWPELFRNFRGLLAKYYSESLLFSDAARHSFLEPDLQSLPVAA